MPRSHSDMKYEHLGSLFCVLFFLSKSCFAVSYSLIRYLINSNAA